MLSSVLLQVPQAQTHSLILTYLDHLMAEQIHCQVDDSPEPHADCPHMKQKHTSRRPLKEAFLASKIVILN